MRRSYYKEIAKLVGLSLGEKFKIKITSSVTIPKHVFYLDEEGLKSEGYSGIWGQTLLQILKGQYEVVKLPFRPRCDETYYFITYGGYLTSKVWDATHFDIALFYMGNCFRTKEEAEAHKDEILSKFKEILSNE